MAATSPQLERQSLQRCGVHAVNNLLQQRHGAFTVDDFEEIADRLVPLSCWSRVFGTHHKASCSRGNYDLNVIQVALHTSNFETTWVRGSEVSTEALHQAAETGSRGFLLNRPETACCGLWKSNHWYALTLHGGSWYLLDSRAAAAMPLSAPAAAEHVAALLEEGGHALRVHPAALPAGNS